MLELPYARSEAGSNREAEIRKVLRGLGADAIGFMVDDAKHLIICQFRLKGRTVRIDVSAAAYEREWRKLNPCGPRTDPGTYAARATMRAEYAVWAVLADWIKATASMIACGFQDVDTAFLPHIEAPDGRRIREVIAESSVQLLPPPEGGRADG